MDWNDPSGKLKPEDMESPLFRSECERLFALSFNSLVLAEPVSKPKRVAIVLNDQVCDPSWFELKDDRTIRWLSKNAGFILKDDDDVRVYIEE